LKPFDVEVMDLIKLLMGSLLSSFKNVIETIALPAPTASYDESHPRLQMIGGEDGVKTACMIYQVNDKKLAIIYCHGNACDIGQMDGFLLKLSQDLKINIISLDYEGYGLTGGTPSEAGCMRSLETVYKHLITSGRKPSDIILYGTSIGTGPTVKLAHNVNLQSEQKLRGILLQTPYTSVVGVVSESIACTSFYTTTKEGNPDLFRTVDLIGDIECPILIIHGRKDEVISYSHSEYIEKLNKKITLITLDDATHNNIESKYYETIIRSLIILV
jgi:pimeloyl-ACP methyl ester carboxylesterase